MLKSFDEKESFQDFGETGYCRRRENDDKYDTGE
jgi:hypothetical protein